MRLKQPVGWQLCFSLRKCKSLCVAGTQRSSSAGHHVVLRTDHFWEYRSVQVPVDKCCFPPCLLKVMSAGGAGFLMGKGCTLRGRSSPDWALFLLCPPQGPPGPPGVKVSERSVSLGVLAVARSHSSVAWSSSWGICKIQENLMGKWCPGLG